METTADRIKNKSTNILGVIGMAVGAATIGVYAVDVMPPAIGLTAMAGTLLSLKGKKEEKTTFKKALLLTLALSTPGGGLAFILPTPINPIVYWKNRKSKQAAENAEMPEAKVLENLIAKVSEMKPQKQLEMLERLSKEVPKKGPFKKGPYKGSAKEDFNPLSEHLR